MINLANLGFFEIPNYYLSFKYFTTLPVYLVGLLISPQTGNDMQT